MEAYTYKDIYGGERRRRNGERGREREEGNEGKKELKDKILLPEQGRGAGGREGRRKKIAEKTEKVGKTRESGEEKNGNGNVARAQI